MGDVDFEEEQKQENTGYINDDLTAVCNSLGKIDDNDGTYMKDRDCKACLREIQRYLNADLKHHTARITLGSYNILKCDLIPLLVQYCDYNEGDPELFNTILRLCTNITSSTILLFGNKEEIENKEEHLKLENKLLNGLYGYKQAFADCDQIWSTLNTHLRHNRDDDLIFERIIILIRNILHIPVDSTADMGSHSEFDTHDMCIYRMEKSGMLNTILGLTADSNKGAEFCFHLTEIIYLLLRNQNPETLAKVSPDYLEGKFSNAEMDEARRRYKEVSERNRRERERRSRITNQFRCKGSTFVVKNMRSLSNNNLVWNGPLITTRDEINFDIGKTRIRKAKNKKPLPSETFMNISDKNTKPTRISYELRVFCEKFIKDVYNDYMQQIKHNLIQKRSQENDETYYLWAIQFFTAFSRHLSLNVDFISETLSTSTLHFIQILMTSYQEKIKIEKKAYQDISKRLHLAIRAYREILYLIRTVSNDPDYCNKIEVIKKNIFTELEYSTLLLNLFQQYDEPKHSYHYLEDLIHTNHIFLELLEEYSKTHGPVPFEQDDDDEDDELEDESDDDLVKEFIDDKEKTDDNDNIQNNEIGVEDTPDDQVNENIIESTKMDDDEINETGEQNNDAKNEEDKFSSDLPDIIDDEVMDKKGKKKDSSKKKRKKKKKKKSKNKDFTSAHFMTRYCCPDVIISHLKVLKNFKTNDKTINLALLKFFERLVYDCKNDVILCQASVFRCLLEIAEYHSSLAGQDGFKTLLIHLIENFGRMANKRRWMFQELLFWKTTNDVIEIENAIDPPPVNTIRKVAEDNMYEANILSDEKDNMEVNNDAASGAAATNYDDDFDELPAASLDELRAELWGSDSDESSINIPAHNSSPPQAVVENQSDDNSDSNHNNNHEPAASDENHTNTNDGFSSKNSNHDGESNQSNDININLSKTNNSVSQSNILDDSDDSNLPSGEINRSKDNKHISDDDSDIEL